MDILFSYGALSIRWFGIFIVLGIFSCIATIYVHSLLMKYSFKPIFEAIIFATPVSLLSARISYALFNWRIYLNNPMSLFFLWQPGLSIYGALLGLILIVAWLGAKSDTGVWLLLDRLAPGLAIAHAVGQWANLGSQDYFGYPTTTGWGIYIDYAFRPIGFEFYDYFKPIFVYHSAWSFMAFIFICIFYYVVDKQKKFMPGSVFLLYMMLFSLGNYLFDGMRILTVSQLYLLRILSVMVFMSSVIFWYYRNNAIEHNKSER